MSTTTLNPSLNSRITEFFDIYGDELDTCNPSAYDLILKVIETGDMKLLEDFIWYYADELDACHPDAFDMLYNIANEFDIEMY